jgi:hypothetical protein
MRKKNGGGKSRATAPLTTKCSESFQRSFFIGSIIVFSFEGIRNSVYTNLYGIPRNSAVLNSKKFRGIKLSQFRIKFRIPRNSQKALPKTPYTSILRGILPEEGLPWLNT